MVEERDRAAIDGEEEEALVRLLLGRARRLLERGWCQRRLAEDALANSVRPDHPEAAAFCIHGALMRSEANLPMTVSDAAWRRMEAALGQKTCGSLAAWNDRPRRTQEEVLRLVDQAMGGK